MRTWLITGISSGFGYEMSKQLLLRGDRVIGTVRNNKKIEKLKREYPDMLEYRVLDITDTQAIHTFVEYVFEKYERIDVVVSNAGYGVLGAIEEISEDEIEKIISTNMTGSIMFIKSVLGYLRRQGDARIIQMSSYCGQVAIRGWGMYCASKAGITRFCETIAQEIQPFNIGVTIVEPGSARTDYFNHVKIANMMEEYSHCHASLQGIKSAQDTKPGDPVKMVKRIIDSVEMKQAPLHLLLGSEALESTVRTLRNRITSYEEQRQLAVSTDVMDFNFKRKKKIHLIPYLGSRKVIVWSVGQEFRNMLHWFDWTEWDSYVECFVDKSNSKAGKICIGKIVKTPEEIQDWSQYFVIVTSTAYYDEIARELRNYGLKETQDFISWRRLIERITLGVFYRDFRYTVSMLINGNEAITLQSDICTIAVEKCLLKCGFNVADIDAVVYAENPLERLAWIQEGINADFNISSRIGKSIGNKLNIADQLERFSHGKWKGKIYFCGQNAAPAMSAFEMSQMDEAAVIVYDNNMWNTTIGAAFEGQYVPLRQLECPDSLELFYNIFVNYYYKWKDVKIAKEVASMGEPVFYDWLKEKWIRVYEDGTIRLNRDCFYLDGEEWIISPKGEKLLKESENDVKYDVVEFKKNLICSIQKIVEEVILKTIAYAKHLTNMESLCLVGGKAIEFAERKRIDSKRFFCNICIQSLEDDFGRTIGAADYAYRRLFCKMGDISKEIKEKDSFTTNRETNWSMEIGDDTLLLMNYSPDNKIKNLTRNISSIDENGGRFTSAFKRQLLVDILDSN